MAAVHVVSMTIATLPAKLYQLALHNAFTDVLAPIVVQPFTEPTGITHSLDDIWLNFKITKMISPDVVDLD